MNTYSIHEWKLSLNLFYKPIGYIIQLAINCIVREHVARKKEKEKEKSVNISCLFCALIVIEQKDDIGNNVYILITTESVLVNNRRSKLFIIVIPKLWSQRH